MVAVSSLGRKSRCLKCGERFVLREDTGYWAGALDEMMRQDQPGASQE